MLLLIPTLSNVCKLHFLQNTTKFDVMLFKGVYATYITKYKKKCWDRFPLYSVLFYYFRGTNRMKKLKYEQPNITPWHSVWKGTFGNTNRCILKETCSYPCMSRSENTHLSHPWEGSQPNHAFRSKILRPRPCNPRIKLKSIFMGKKFKGVFSIITSCQAVKPTGSKQQWLFYSIVLHCRY